MHRVYDNEMDASIVVFWISPSSRAYIATVEVRGLLQHCDCRMLSREGAEDRSPKLLKLGEHFVDKIDVLPPDVIDVVKNV